MIWKGECLRRNRYEIEKVGGVLGEVAFMKLALILSKDKDSNGIVKQSLKGIEGLILYSVLVVTKMVGVLRQTRMVEAKGNVVDFSPVKVLARWSSQCWTLSGSSG